MAKSVKFKVINYLEALFDKQSLEKILDVIAKKPSEALRKNEEIWKKQFSSKKIGEKEQKQILFG